MYYVLTEAGSFKKHRSYATGENPFHWEQCTKSFSVASSLKMHRRTHSVKKPFSRYQHRKLFFEACNVIKHKKLILESNYFLVIIVPGNFLKPVE